MRVIGDRDVCIGAGQCVLAAPEVFDQDDDEGLVVVLNDQPGEDQREGVSEAAEMCPSGAIELR